MMVPLMKVCELHSSILRSTQEDNNLFKPQGRLRRISNPLDGPQSQISGVILAMK